MIKYKLIAVAILTTLIFFNCKKTTSNQNGNQTSYKTFPTNNSNQYWKVYYSASWQTNDTSKIQHCIDSLYVSNDTIGLNIISNNSGIIDTNWVNYNIIKSNRMIKRFGHTNWETLGVLDFGIFRIDTILNRIYSVNTSCFCWPGGTPVYPTNFYFNERIIFDYNLQNNDTCYIKAMSNSYHTIVKVDSIMFNGNIIKSQNFIYNSTDTVSKRTQYGCLFNTCNYSYVALPNSSVPPSINITKYVYYDSPNDSIIINEDTQIYP